MSVRLQSFNRHEVFPCVDRTVLEPFFTKNEIGFWKFVIDCDDYSNTS